MPLTALHILLIEDEALIAMDLEIAFEDAGASVIGPIGELHEGIEAAQDRAIDVALLDVDLSGKDVFPIADILVERCVPFAFHTGHAQRYDLEKLYPGKPVCVKPVEHAELIATLRQLSRPLGRA